MFQPNYSFGVPAFSFNNEDAQNGMIPSSPPRTTMDLLNQLDASRYPPDEKPIFEPEPNNTTAFAMHSPAFEEDQNVYAQLPPQVRPGIFNPTSSVDPSHRDVFTGYPASAAFGGFGFGANGFINSHPHQKQKMTYQPTPTQTPPFIFTNPQSSNPFTPNLAYSIAPAAAQTGFASSSQQPKHRSHNPELATAPPNTARLPPCEMSASEVLYLFPHHTQWPKAILRLLGSGFTVDDMASMALYARGIVDDEVQGRRCMALRHQTSEAGRAKFGDPSWIMTKATPGQLPVVTNYDVSAYIPRHNRQLRSIELLDVARDVKWWPCVSDRGIVSQVVRFARDNPVVCADFTTDDIPTIAAQQGFTMPRDASRSDWDAICLRNFRRALDSVKTRIAKGTL